MDTVRNQDLNLFLAQYVVVKVRYDQVRDFLQFSKLVQNALVQENKFLIHVKIAEVWGKNKRRKKYPPLFQKESMMVPELD